MSMNTIGHYYTFFDFWPYGTVKKQDQFSVLNSISPC